MTKIEDFRAFTLYKRSLQLLMTISKAIQTCEDNLPYKDAKLIQKRAICLPIRIASAIAQVNMNVRFRKLNEAVAIMTQLKIILERLNRRKIIDDQLWQEIENISLELIKLFNGYFGWMGRRKEKGA